ncbi:MAG: hypothetical protein P8L45_00560 [Longimicrobiales bacterium]|nr:hypothetical protein [Longimicrobiales bacterium]
MSDDVFDAGWLALREDADHRSRAHDLAQRLAEAGTSMGWSAALDLGSGTGSNLRYLAPRLPWVESWTLLDHDVTLLGGARAPTVPDPIRVVGDLALEGIQEIGSAHLVTASALLDLVSKQWLTQAVDACAARGAAALFALSYDGVVRWAEEDADDALVRDTLNEHQQREKGLGAALGPDASHAAETLFEAEGYEVVLQPSPWRLSGPADRDLTVLLMRGWIEAALEIRPTEAARLHAWEARRNEAVTAGHYSVEVGHYDLLALPPRRAE